MTTDYAFRTLIYLFRQRPGALVKAEDIVEEMKIPQNYLQRVIGVMKGAGYIETVRGQRGGYRLSAKAEGLDVHQVFRLYEPEQLHRCLDQEDACSRDGYISCPFSVVCELLQQQMDSTMAKIPVKSLAYVGERDTLLQNLKHELAVAEKG